MNLTRQQTIHSRRGFTLIEVLVYVFVFTIVSISSITVLMSLQKVVFEHRTNQIMTRNISSVFERILFDIRAADSVDVGASTLGSDPGSLVLLAGPSTTEYTLSGGTLLVSVDGGAANPVTDENITVTNLRFDRFDNTVTEAVRVSLTMQAEWGGMIKVEDFTNTSVLLGSYD